MTDPFQPQPSPPPQPENHYALRIALLYAVFAALWILGSDGLLAFLVADPAMLTQLSMLKGWAFVAITATLLYASIRRVAKNPTGHVASAGVARRTRAMLIPFALFALVIVALAAAAITFSYYQERGREAARIEAIADLQMSQLARWLGERESQAKFISSSAVFARLYRQWRGAQDPESGEQLLQRLAEFRKANGYSNVVVLDARGNTVGAESGNVGDTPPPLRAAARAAMAEGVPQSTEIYLPPNANAATLRLSVVAPLMLTGPPAVAAVGLEIDPGDFLVPTLRVWPIPSPSGTLVLVRHNGDQVVGMLGQNPLPLATPDLLAARVIRGDAPEGVALDATDFRGIPVLGVVRRIPGSHWYLVAKVDRADIIAEVTRDSVWIVATALLLLFAAGTGLYLLRERQELRYALLRRTEHAATIKALRLLDAIAESSTDAIFAKDRAGRYLLFNRGAGLLWGKPSSEVIGHDDRELFPPDDAELVMRNDARAMNDNCVRTYEETLNTPTGETTFLATKGPLRDAEGNVLGMFGIARDITDRKRAETAVRANAARYRSLFEGMLNGLAHCRLILDRANPVDWEYLAVNPAFERLTGLKDVIGRCASDVIPGLFADDPGLLETYGRVALTGEPAHFESHVRALGRWFSVYAYRPAEGEFVAVFEDITERKNAEAALRMSEDRLRIFVAHAPAAIAMLDRDMRYLAVSHRWLADYRIGARDIIGVSHYEVFPEITDRWKEMHRRCLSGAVEKCDEDPFPRADGRLDWVKWEVRPWNDDQGNVGGLLLFSEVITERKNSELALTQSRQRLDMALAAARMGVFEWDFVTGSIYVSPGMWANLGTMPPTGNASAMTIEMFRQRMHPDDVGRVFAAAKRAIGEHAEFVEEYRATASEGRWKWLMVLGRAEYLPDGTPARALGVVLDIDARKRAETALEESSAHYRTMVNSLSEGVMIFDRDGHPRQCNPSAERILGITLAEMLDSGRSIATWHPIRPDGTVCPQAELPVAQTLATGQPQRGAVLGEVRADGSIAWLLLNSEPIRPDETAPLSGVMVSFTDITERFATELQLRKLSLAVEQSPESIIVTDLEGRIEYVNEAFMQVSGYGRDEVLGQNPRVLKSGLTPAATYGEMWKAIAAGAPWRGEFVNQRKNGEHYIELATVSPVRDTAGKITHYLAIKQDVTRHKRLEEELDRHRHHLEELVATRTGELRAAMLGAG